MSTATKPGRSRDAAGEQASHSAGVQTTQVSADEAGMRVDRFLEARFPGLSFSHIQRVIRKGELRVNGRRAQPKQQEGPKPKMCWGRDGRAMTILPCDDPRATMPAY